MRLSILPKMADWFRNLSFSRKIVLTVFMALFILSTPILYQLTARLIKSKTCEMSGGKLTHAGMDAKLICIRPYPDGGKPCSSSEECMGGCVIYEPPVKGQPTPSVGVCRYSHPEFGCDAPIENPDFFACP